MAEDIRHDKPARQLRLLSDALDSGRLGPVRRLVNTLSPAEIGNLLESLPPAKRSVVWGLVDSEDDGEVLVHVGDEVREAFLAHAREAAAGFAPQANGKWLADLYQLATQRLHAAGVARVFGGGFCTWHEKERFYSFRRDRNTGRMASLIWIE